MDLISCASKYKNYSKSQLFQKLKNNLTFRWHYGRVDVKLYHLGMLCIPCFSPLSIEECHNILPCKRALRPSQNRTWRFPSSGSSAKLTHRATVCKYTINATCSVPAEAIVAFLQESLGSYRARWDMRAILPAWCYPFQSMAYATHPSTFCCQALRVSRLLRLNGHYPICTPTMS